MKHKNLINKTLVTTLALSMMLIFTACGSNGTNDENMNNENTNTETETAEETQSGLANLEGSVMEILNTVYENADLDTELQEAMAYYETSEILDDNEEYILGTTDIDYTEGIYSAPMMSSIAYQCVLLRVSENADVEEVKAQLAEHADPRKWICVEAESTVIENVGDMILFIMADEATASAINEAFQALGN